MPRPSATLPPTARRAGLLGIALCAAVSCNSGGEDADLLVPAEVDPGPAVNRRLTQPQYLNSVRALFGDDITISTGLEPDLRIKGLNAIGAGVASTSPRGVEQYEDAAYEIAEQAITEDRRTRWMPCEMADTAGSDDDCTRQALTSLTLRAWRQPATEAQLDELVAVAGAAADTLEDPYEGLVFGIAGVLQSPWFLFRTELGQDDGAGGWQLTPYELATRLSFLLWNAPPDDALLELAASGGLDTREGIDGAAVEMLEDPRTRQGMRGWITDMLELDDLDDLEKDPDIFANMSPSLGSKAREEVLLTVEDLIFEQDADIGRWLTQRETFVDRELAAIYQVRAPSIESFARIQLPPTEQRRGLLGQVGFLALHGHSNSTSATMRGLAVRESLMCQEIPAPPSGVDTSIPEATGDRPTLRDRVESHLTVETCAGCHRGMDLVGLSLENYDGIGAWRETENGYPIDASGDLDGVSVSGPSDLSESISESRAFTECMVRQVTRRALGRRVDDGEKDELERLYAVFQARERRVRPLWLEVVTSPLFREIAAPNTDAEVAP